MSSASATLDHTDTWRPAVNPWIIALTVTLATFMEVLDTSIANVALPHIAGGLSAGQDESTWVLTSYLVSNAIVLPLSGWLSSIMGRKNFYMSCVALFTVSSFFCGLAPNLATLIVCRILQGVGGGGLQPSEQAILADTFPPAKRGMPFALYRIAVVTAPAIGPTLGGWITDNFTWRWIFFINIPVGILSIVLTTRLIQDPPYFKRRKLSETRIDYVGLGFVALGLGALQIVLDKGQREDWLESNFIVMLSLIAASALIFLIIWEWRNKDPIIDLHLFRDRTFAVSNLLMFMLGFALLGSTLLLPLFMQTLLGYTAEQAGLALMPGGFTIILLLPLVGFLLSRYSPRWLLLFGLVVLSASLFHMTGFALDIDFRTVAVARMFQAAGMAFLFVPINTAAYAFLPREKNNAASGLMNLARNIGGSVGISLVTTMLDRRTQVHLNDLSRHLSASNPAFQSMLQGTTQAMRAHGASAAFATQQAYAMIEGTVQRQATMLAYIDDFRLLGITILAMVPLVFLMKKGKPGGGIAVHQSATYGSEGTTSIVPKDFGERHVVRSLGRASKEFGRGTSLLVP